MLEKVDAYIEEQHLLVPGMNIVIGCSGGADSMCLMYLLKELSQKYSLHLTAVHVNHMLRGEEAERDQQFVQKICNQENIPLVIKKEDVGVIAKEKHLSFEEAGRFVRYEEFYRCLKEQGGGVIAIAHHRDDLCETMMWNLMRGSGLHGLRGIVPKQGKIIRPLLCVSGSDIREWMGKHGYSWVEDSSNQELHYTRNQIRKMLFPVMQEISPGCFERMCATAKEISKTDEYFQKEAEQFFTRYGELFEEDVFLNLESFRSCDEIVKPYVIKHVLMQMQIGLKDIGRTHLQQVCDLANKQVGKKVDLPGNCQVSVTYCQLKFTKKVVEEINKSNCIMNITTFPRKKEQKIIEKLYTKWFDYDKIKNNICLRYRESGDQIAVLPGKKKKLKDYFIDEKIPKEQRNRILVLADGKQVIWVVGHRMSEDYKISEETKTILQIQIKE